MKLHHTVSTYVIQGWTTLVCVLSVTSATYVSWNNDNDYGNIKTNEVTPPKRHGPLFKSDQDISRYLKLYGLDMMLWRCRNAIQPYWEWKPLPVLELYCEAIGTLTNVEWYHNGKKIEIDATYTKGSTRKHKDLGRHGQLIVPHYSHGRYFASWIDFRLKIYDATIKDSGVYTFKAYGPSGETEEQVIYVDISEKKNKKKNRISRTMRGKKSRINRHENRRSRRLRNSRNRRKSLLRRTDT